MTCGCAAAILPAKPIRTKKPFSIVMPPPNVTGQLHMGHALDATLQDILIRYKRMQGYAALWVPGTDHAGIATADQGRGDTAQGRGPDPLRPRAARSSWSASGTWKKQYGDRIVEQLKKLGVLLRLGRASASPWTRAARRPCERRSVNLYEKGLIYQGNRIINWCPHCRTALSDAEVEYKEQARPFLAYPLSHSRTATIS